jgi:FkbM family methyltransferase
MAGGDPAVRVVFDVGANNGSDSLPLASQMPRVQFHAFEPTPTLARDLRRSSKSLGNYHVVAAAVAAHDGETWLYVAKDREQSSTHIARDAHPWWKYSLPTVDEKIRVPALRLDTYCRENDIERVDIVHIDTQGSDLLVLESMGALLDTVRAGVVEVPARVNVHDTFDRKMMIVFLRAHGLEPVDVIPMNSFNAEQNLFFKHVGSNRGRRLTTRMKFACRVAVVPLRPPASIRHQLAVRSRVGAAWRRLHGALARGSSARG